MLKQIDPTAEPLPYTGVGDITGAQVAAFAEFAARYCEEWFGTPPDETWPTLLWLGPINACQRNVFMRSYVITIGPCHPCVAAVYSTVAHEVYHRYTRGRRGASSVLWIDEMLACRSSAAVLRLAGCDAYVSAVERVRREEGYIAMAQVFRVRRTRFRWTPQAGQLPTRFYFAVDELGARLEQIVGWERLRTLALSSSIDAWLNSQPEQLRTRVRETLRSAATAD